jgi:hypothetical protein
LAKNVAPGVFSLGGREMTKATGAMILAASVAVVSPSCGANDTGSTAPPTGSAAQTVSAAAQTVSAAPKAVSAAPKAVSAAMTVHASLSFGEEHVLQFVEYKNGMVGVVETGRNMVDVPKVTPDLANLPWTDLYRHFAGASAVIPEGMAAAQARASAKTVAPMSSAGSDIATEPDSGGAGPHFYNDVEQAWFRNTYCNGAGNCVQGWNWTTMTSKEAITHASAYAMVGSEGTTNATFKQYWWDCSWSLLEGWVCFWLEFDSVVVVPGHWVNRTESGSSYYIQWQLTGAGPNTEVSSSAFY